MLNNNKHKTAFINYQNLRWKNVLKYCDKSTCSWFLEVVDGI